MAGRLDEVEPLLTTAEQAFDQARRRAVPSLDRPRPQPPGQRPGRRSRSSAPTWPSSVAKPNGEASVRPGRPAEQRTEDDELLGTPSPGYHLAVARTGSPASSVTGRTRAGRPVRRTGRADRRDLAAPCGLSTSGGSSTPRAAWTPRRAPTGGRLEVARSTGVATARRHGARWAGRGGLRAGRASTRPPQHASEGIGCAASFAYTQPLAAGLATLARIRQAEGDAAGALDADRRGRAGRDAPGVGRPA